MLPPGSEIGYPGGGDETKPGFRSGLPDWMIAPPDGSMNTMALVEHTNPITGEKFTAPNGGYRINPEYIKSQLNTAYTDNVGRDIGAPGLDFYSKELLDNMRDSTTGKSWDQILADLDYSTEGQAYTSPAETQTASLNQAYMDNLGRPIQDAGSNFYNDQLNQYNADPTTGKSLDQIRADLDYSAEGQAYTSPAETQTSRLNQAYIDNFGRGIGSAGQQFYNDQLNQYNADPTTGKSWEQIMADLDYSAEGQAYTSPAEQAAIDAQNAAGGGGGNNTDMAAFHQSILDANRAKRLADGTQYVNNDKGDLMNVFKGAQEYGQGFVDDLSTGIGNYIKSGGIGGAAIKGLNNIFGGGDKQTAENNANAANAAAANAASNVGGIFEYGIGGLVNRQGPRRSL